MTDLADLLKYLTEQKGSDLHIKVGSPPHVRLDGRLVAAPFEPMDPAEIDQMARQILPPQRLEDFTASAETDFAHSVPGLGRFRVNVYRQRGSVSMVFRRVVPGIPALADLGLPPAVERLADEQSGLVVITGPSTSGKTTTVAAVLDRINESRPAHIVTVEDPIEVLHADKQAIVSQREVGTDTPGFAEAMGRILRQDPDVIFVSDVRDAETAWAALTAADSGHLVLAIMHTSTVAETLARIVDFFPPFQERQVRQTMASSLRGVVSQRLLERADGRGRTPAVEVLVNTNKVFEHLQDPDPALTLDQLVAEGEYHGMQTFDQALFGLYKDGLVSLRDALAVATNPDELRIALQQAGLNVG